MRNEERSKQRKSYIIMRMIYDFSMAALILGMGVVMFFGEAMNIHQIAELDTLMRYLFGSLCLLYGGFRLYRGIRHNY